MKTHHLFSEAVKEMEQLKGLGFNNIYLLKIEGTNGYYVSVIKPSNNIAYKIIQTYTKNEKK